MKQEDKFNTGCIIELATTICNWCSVFLRRPMKCNLEHSAWEQKEKEKEETLPHWVQSWLQRC